MAKITNAALKDVSSMLGSYAKMGDAHPSITSIDMKITLNAISNMLSTITEPLLGQVQPAVNQIIAQIGTTDNVLSAIAYLQNITQQARNISSMVQTSANPTQIQSVEPQELTGVSASASIYSDPINGVNLPR